MRFCFFAHAGSANTKSWANHFADVLGHDVHVVSLCPADGLSGRVTLHVLPARGSRTLRYPLALPEARKVLKSIAPDILVGYRVASYGFLAAASGFHPLALAAQGRVVPPGDHFKRLLAVYALRRADLVNAWAPHMASRLVELGTPPDRILTCPRGIDLDLFRPGIEVSDREPNLIVTRTMHRVYRHDLILEALSRASAERAQLRAVFVGDGEARADLEQLSRRLGVDDRVEFLGEVDPSRLAELLGLSAVYVSAVPTDGVSASLLEAMATGCFPIVTANDANRLWLTQGQNGFMVEGDDAASFARAIVSALDDVELRRSAAGRNRQVVEERADLRRNMRTMEAAYQSLVEEGPRGQA